MNKINRFKNYISPNEECAIAASLAPYTECTLCARRCRVDRTSGARGVCGQGAEMRAARAALHLWEEPVISGVYGSGAVFFSGCNLRCVFCQNHDIAIGDVGKEITVERLCEIFFELKTKGAHNINLVTGTPYIPHIAEAIKLAKDKGFDLPFVFNCGGYEDVDALKMLDGLIDIYLPDLKYYSPELSLRYSKAADYFERAAAAIAEMYRQVGSPILEERSNEEEGTAKSVHFEDAVSGSEERVRTAYDNPPLMKKGVIVRHLLLPGCTKDSKKILRYLHETYGDNIYISIMNQYTPLEHITNGYNDNGELKYPELTRKVTDEEYDRVVDFALKLGIENAFIQEGDTAKESFIPAFDYEGI